MVISNSIHKKDSCAFLPLSAKELAVGDWQSLVTLDICNNIIMKGGVLDLEMRNADHRQDESL